MTLHIVAGRGLALFGSTLLLASSTLAQTEAGARTTLDRTGSWIRPLPAPRSSAQELPDTTVGLLLSGFDTALAGAVPAGDASPEPIDLSLQQALDAAFANNLGHLLSSELQKEAEAKLQQVRSETRPQLELEVAQLWQQINFDGSPFRRFRPPGVSFGESVESFDTFDARILLDLPLYDPAARQRTLEAREHLASAQQRHERTRSLVVLFVGNLYLRAVAESPKAEAARQRLLRRQADAGLVADLREVGAATELDAARAELEIETARQHWLAASNEAQRMKLRLRRAIGLPLGQEVRLTEKLGYNPVSPLDRKVAYARALGTNQVLASLEAEWRAAQAATKAALAERKPSVELQADIGRIGPEASQTETTTNVGAFLRLPLWTSGEIAGRAGQGRARERRAAARAADYRAALYYAVEEALNDEATSSAGVQAAMTALDLAEEQVALANDRLANGVGNVREIAAAQEAQAESETFHIEAVLSHRLAKGALARALGMSAEDILAVLENEVEPLSSNPEASADSEAGDGDER